MPKDYIIAWCVAALFALLYMRNVAKCHRVRKEKEFWQSAATYAAVGAGLGWFGLFNHRRALNDERSEHMDNSYRQSLELERLQSENADLRKQLNLPESGHE